MSGRGLFALLWLRVVAPRLGSDALVFASHCLSSFLTDQRGELSDMLNVWLTSGEMLAEFPVHGLTDVKSLKQDLRRKCGVPRFRQRLLNAGALMEDSTRLLSAMDVQLILLPFISASADQRDELIDSIFGDAVAQV